MQNLIQKFRQSPLLSRNQVFYLKNWKLWRAPTTIDVNNFCWNFAHVPYLQMSTKGCVGFLFCLECALFAKIKKIPGVYTLTETSFINNSRSKQNKKNNSTHPFVDILKTGTCAKFQHKILNFTAVEARLKFSIF